MSLLTFIAAIPSSVLQNLPSSSTPTFNEIINPILYFIGILAVFVSNCHQTENKRLLIMGCGCTHPH